MITRFAGWFLIFSVLRYRDFRLFWIGLISQVTGQQMMMVTMGWLAYDLTGSPLTLGLINLLSALPRLTISVLGGVLADKWDQRKLITDKSTYPAFHAVTALIPFTGKQTLRGIKELPAAAWIGGIGVAVLLRYFHTSLFG